MIRAWSWAAGRGLVPAAVADALRHVGPLVPGRSDARVPPPRTAVADDRVTAALPHLHPDPVRRAVLEAMVLLHRANRYRAVLIRWCKKPENFLATLQFALALITYRAAGLTG